MKNICCLFLFSLFTVYCSLHAQPPASYSSSDIFLQLKKLNVLGSVLYIAAHPDDENTRLLTYLSKEKQYRTGYLSLTRGDGGQNLIGDEQGIELGLIRTQELLAARRIDGAEQFFSRAYDFGFCKTADEALRTWGHDKILSDVVWVIRNFQPDIIITRFPGDERAGHGHHSASAILANEAFKAAADSSKFPEQFQFGVRPWQAKRILWNTFNFSGERTAGDEQFKVDVGVYNNLLGKSYGEIAAESRSQHKSQGFAVPRQRGQLFEFFTTTGGDAPKDDLMDGVNNNWQRVPRSNDIETKINNITSQYDFQHPENSVDALINLYQTLQQLPDGYWRNKKLTEVQQLIAACAGLFAEATSPDEYAVQGDSIHVQFVINKRTNTDVILKKISMKSFDTPINNNLVTNQNFILRKSFLVGLDEKTSQPYWLEKPLLQGSYDVNNQQQIGSPENEPAYKMVFIVNIRGVDFNLERPVQNKFNDPVTGEVYEPLFVVPAITGTFDEPLYILNGAKQKTIQLQLYASRLFKQADMQIEVHSNWRIQNSNFTGTINKHSTQTLKATVFADNSESASEARLKVNKLIDSTGYAYKELIEEQRKISYEHIPDIIYFRPLVSKLEKIDINIKGKNIGYITGAGDKVPQALAQLGYDIKTLTETEITEENLKQFDAVITGVRAYNVHEWLDEKYNVLMRYVENGGNLIVQYNTNSFAGPMQSKIGPYPFTISRTRVTDETAKVNMLLPNHSALNYPNKITEKDFEGWIQERSIYHAEQLDNHYVAPLGMGDANESQSNGGLIIAPYGKGNFVYTGLVFFRELPAGVPGAFRLMANLIALPENR